MSLAWWCSTEQVAPDSERATHAATESTKDGRKPDHATSMPGAGLIEVWPGKAPSDMPALEPYWGKPAVRNLRGDRGNVGIIRSPVRASIPPDTNGRERLQQGVGTEGTYSITSSASASSAAGTVSPSAAAVLRLMTITYLIGI
jgi:hypothetical protein